MTFTHQNRAWFIQRIGKEICTGKYNIVRVKSIEHAKELYMMQFNSNIKFNDK